MVSSKEIDIFPQAHCLKIQLHFWHAIEQRNGMSFKSRNTIKIRYLYLDVFTLFPPIFFAMVPFLIINTWKTNL